MFWGVAVLEPNGERKAALNAGRLGFETYSPRVITVDKRGQPKIAYMFPRYMFVKIVDQWQVLLSTYGITDIISFGKQVGKLPKNFVPELKARSTDTLGDEEGLLDIRTDRQKGPIFCQGDVVRLVGDTAFSGLTGVVSECAADRVKVLFEILGRRTPVTAHPGSFALV